MENKTFIENIQINSIYITRDKLSANLRLMTIQYECCVNYLYMKNNFRTQPSTCR